MKNTINLLIGIFLMIIVCVGINKENSVLNQLSVENIEALASGEIIVQIPCVTTCTNCWCFYPPIPEDPTGYWADGEYINYIRSFQYLLKRPD